jgi:hypothetical protein
VGGVRFVDGMTGLLLWAVSTSSDPLLPTPTFLPRSGSTPSEDMRRASSTASAIIEEEESDL